MENCKQMTRKELIKNKDKLSVCNGCTIINWHENKKCWLCGLYKWFRPANGEDLSHIVECDKNTLFSL